MNANRAGVAGAFSVLLVAILNRFFDIDVGVESAAAITTVFTWAGGYINLWTMWVHRSPERGAVLPLHDEGEKHLQEER